MRVLDVVGKEDPADRSLRFVPACCIAPPQTGQHPAHAERQTRSDRLWAGKTVTPVRW